MKKIKSKPYSVKEVAMRLSSSHRDEDIAFLMRQIKHWTNNDLLHTVGTKHIGTGRSREYSKEELIAAAYLQELAKYGLTIASLMAFRNFYNKRMKEEESKKALLGGTDGKGNGGHICFYGLGDRPDKSQGFVMHPCGEFNEYHFWSLDTGNKDMEFQSVLAINCLNTVKRLNLD